MNTASYEFNLKDGPAALIEIILRDLERIGPNSVSPKLRDWQLRLYRHILSGTQEQANERARKFFDATMAFRKIAFSSLLARIDHKLRAQAKAVDFLEPFPGMDN